jgi:hypothetical protein
MALTGSELPIWRSLGYLRLAEERGAKADAEVALVGFENIHSKWGTLRTSALLGTITDAELERQVTSLGPMEVFRPGGRWLF